jgi:hypothetical protein
MVANNSGLHQQIDRSTWQQDFSTSKERHQIHAASLLRQIDGTAGHAINSRQLIASANRWINMAAGLEHIKGTPSNSRSSLASKNRRNSRPRYQLQASPLHWHRRINIAAGRSA